MGTPHTGRTRPTTEQSEEQRIGDAGDVPGVDAGAATKLASTVLRLPATLQ